MKSISIIKKLKLNKNTNIVLIFVISIIIIKFAMEDIDLRKIQCIPHPKTIAIMNQYLLSATQHINKYLFSYLG